MKTAKEINKRRQELVKLLQELVRLPSESCQRTGYEKEAQAFVAQRMKGMGLEVDIFEADMKKVKAHPAYLDIGKNYKNRPTVVGRLKGRRAHPSLMLLAHIDVVPAGDLAEWKHNPWGGELCQDKVYGRGAWDDKSGVASMLFAAQVLVENDFKPETDIYLASTMDEENGCGNGMIILTERGYRPDSALYLDGYEDIVLITNSGGGDFFIEIKGKRGVYVNGWRIMKRVMQGFKRYDKQRLRFIRKHPLYVKHPHIPSTINIKPLMGSCRGRDLASNILRLKGSINTIVGEYEAEIKKKLEEVTFAALREFLVKVRITYPNVWFEPSHTSKKEKITQVVSRSYKEVTGKPALVCGGSKSDSFVLRNHSRIPLVGFGAGKVRRKGIYHQPDEYVRVKDLVKTAQVTARVIENWP